uniref:DNA_MISMATCH_REPAIR_2 domain-containing protein n=1 Tax=Panagrellus redivivus TaxID=6233 RepID=A0A7E4UUR5_PANRE
MAVTLIAASIGDICASFSIEIDETSPDMIGVGLVAMGSSTVPALSDPRSTMNNMASQSSDFNISSFNASKTGQPKYKQTAKPNKNNTTASSDCIIAALIEGRGQDKGVIGICCMDIRFPEMTLSEFFDSSSYTKLKTRLAILDPVEIVVPESSDKNNHMRILADVVKSAMPSVTLTTIQKRFFNDRLGIDVINKLGAPECCNVDTSVVKKYYCMSAAFALIKYIEYVQNLTYENGTMRITYEAIDDCCLIDVHSWANLDLINVKSSHHSDKTLFSVLNKCVTVGGTRLLRSCLLQPSGDVQRIEERLDVVAEFVKNQVFHDRVRNLLANLSDLQFLISLCVGKSQNIVESREESMKSIRSKITQMIALKKVLVVVMALGNVLSTAKSAWIVKHRNRLFDKRLAQITELIDEKLDSSVLLRKSNNSGGMKDATLFAIRPGQHVVIDLSRKAYTELLDDVHAMAAEEQVRIPGITLTYAFTRGYYFSLTCKDPLTMQLPEKCIHIIRNRASVTFTTRDLIKYNDRLIQAESEILFKSNIFVDQIVASIRALLPALHLVIEFMTHLDMMTALGAYSTIAGCVRPVIDSEMIVRNGRHPLLEDHEIVPNDTYIVPESRFLVITGPNMAGKSTYMKQVCLIQILAQLGCFVPADFASFVPMERIFSRIGHNDDLTKNLSAFAVEMSEMAIILPHANERSLIVIDELARSTSTEEGLSICYAMCEHLIKSNAFVMFATHFLDLAWLELNFSTVQNLHFEVQTITRPDGSETIKPSHRLHKGMYKGPLYGFELAELTTFPPSVIEDARKLAETFRANVVLKQLEHGDPTITRQKELVYVARRIMRLNDLTTDENHEKIGKLLVELRQRLQEHRLL